MPAADNERAIRSYKRVGFRPVGILRQAERGPDGRWRDALAMDLLAAELREKTGIPLAGNSGSSGAPREENPSHRN